MPIASITRTETPQPAGPKCSVCQTMAALDDTEAAALKALMSDPEWRYQELSDRLLAEGVDLPAASLSRHARGRCWAREKLRGA